MWPPSLRTTYHWRWEPDKLRTFSCGQPRFIKKSVLIPNATHFVLFEKQRSQFFEEVLRFLKE